MAGWFGATLLNLVAPPRCVCCDTDLPEGQEELLCEDCIGRLAPLAEWTGCPRCGGLGRPLAEGARCSECHDFRLFFDQVTPLGKYDGPLRDTVLRMKRPDDAPLSMAVARLLASRRGEQLLRFRPKAVVPIPMHWLRRLWRGANHTDLLAQCIARQLNIPVVQRCLVRRRPTVPQKSLLPRQRFRNVKGAFGLRGRIDRWKGSHVLLVDDILTTGATCSEAARVFKDAGAAAVAVAVVARAGLTQAVAGDG